jgi:hypothetical protein
MKKEAIKIILSVFFLSVCFVSIINGQTGLNNPPYNIDIKKFYDNGLNYYFANVFQGSDKLFLTTYSYGKNPQNYFLFKPESQTGSLLVNKSGTSTGFINDLDGGLDFWPIGTITDKQVFMPISILRIQKELDQIKTNKESIKFPDKQQQLIKMISESDPFNNPILIIITLK